MYHLPIGTQRLRHYAVFSDESAQTGHRHMVIGGVSTSSCRVDGISNQIARIRSESQFPGDSLQWKHITRRKMVDYEKLSDLALHLIREHIVDFTAVVVDNHQLKHHQFNDGDSETGYLKFLSELFLSYIRKYRKPPEIACFHGQRSSRFEMEQIRGILNSRAGKKICYNYLPFNVLEHRDPSISDMHQLNDFILGATSWHWNPGMRRDVQSPKSQLAQLFQRNIGYEMFEAETPVTAPHFDIWKLRLS